jgi:phosphocarrier protein
MVEKQYKVIDETGIHARTAAILVKAAAKFNAELQLQYNEKKANLKSIMGIMSLGVVQGVEIKIIANGDDEQEALQGMNELFMKESLAV